MSISYFIQINVKMATPVVSLTIHLLLRIMIYDILPVIDQCQMAVLLMTCLLITIFVLRNLLRFLHVYFLFQINAKMAALVVTVSHLLPVTAWRDLAGISVRMTWMNARHSRVRTEPRVMTM